MEELLKRVAECAPERMNARFVPSHYGLRPACVIFYGAGHHEPLSPDLQNPVLWDYPDDALNGPALIVMLSAVEGAGGWTDLYRMGKVYACDWSTDNEHGCTTETGATRSEAIGKAFCAYFEATHA